MAESSFDLAVIGGGPGGYVAAIRAAQLGMSVTVIEREQLGGICLNWGCIPTKSLLRSSEIFNIMDNLETFGIKADNVSFDVGAIVKRSRNVARRLNSGVAHLLKKNNVTVIKGHGRIAGSGKIAITVKDGNTIDVTSKHTILATGARARSLTGLETNSDYIWTYKEAMVPEIVPETLLVIGSGAIGMEFASFYSDLGAEVTVVELLDRILPIEDEEISRLAQKAFEDQGMKFHTSAKVINLKPEGEVVTASIDTEDGMQQLAAERVILAVGIVGNVEDIGIESTAIEVDKSHIVVDKWMQTGEAEVYAIGDLVGPPWLALKASHEAVICVERIAGLDTHPLDISRIPSCTYCRPQIASIGISEATAIEAGHHVRVGRFPYVGNGKAIVMGEAEGMIKTVFDAKTGALLGAHMLGAEVTELIQGYVIAMNLESTEAELMSSVFAHPTLSEMLHESVLDAYDRVIHF